MLKFRAALLLFLLFAVASAVAAQVPIRAKSEAGKDVILYPDGTWKYAQPVSEPATSGRVHNKPSSAQKLYKPSRGNFGIWYDETKWREKVTTDPDEKLRFNLIGGDAYVMIIVEEIPIPLDTLKSAAFQNAKAATGDARITKEEMRMVNGKQVMVLMFEDTVQKIPFSYYGYYYSGKQAAIQLVGFTAQSVFPKYEAEFTKFLDGLEVY